MLPAATQRARIRVGLASGTGVIAAAIAGQVAGFASSWVTVLAIVLAAFGAYVALPQAIPVAEPAPPPLPVVSDDDMRWRSLRHDLRGILSPALLMSDRLLMSTQDPLAKRTAETMIDGIERAEKRLSRDPEPEQRGSAP